jgi:hypothetical protein
MKRLLVAAVLASSPALSAPVGPSAPTKQEAEFAPRKAYRECLNRNFALRLIRDRNVASPETIAEGAMLDCRAEEGNVGRIRGRTHAHRKGPHESIPGVGWARTGEPVVAVIALIRARPSGYRPRSWE